MKAIIFTVFVIVSYLLYSLFQNDRNVEHFPIDPTGKYYNPL